MFKQGKRDRTGHKMAVPSILSAALLALATLASFLGSWWWLLDIPSHFRPQLAAASLIVLVVSLRASSWAAAILCFVLLAANVLPLAPYAVGASRAAGSSSPVQLRVLTLNLHDKGTAPDAFRRLIEKEAPDVILLTEVPDDESPLLAHLSAAYPHRTPNVQGEPYDVVLLSKWKIQNWSKDRRAASYLPVLTTLLCDPALETRCLTVVGLHAARPMSRAGRRQRAQLDLVVESVRSAPTGNAVVMGDLNLTPWSAAFRNFLDAAGLQIHPQERGLTATWLSRVPLFGLMIDHVLAGPDVRIIQTHVGDDVGSDHLPVIAHLALNQGP